MVTDDFIRNLHELANKYELEIDVTNEVGEREYVILTDRDTGESISLVYALYAQGE